ncbi:YeeE/YedE family membrane protein [Roseibium sp. TrichSKD4]|uniref:YeeE/YedE family protein n=1 Tax=Roseibium sp. TrichSKD4 TaxID=744980 RepID=UPI0001E57634|nr:YeeE/YedE family protein [Roseibium sp. TrichSKD4]EFO29437.1 YeeE/YedE family membrane protein [Roseibium sp. TrichSKD4]
MDWLDPLYVLPFAGIAAGAVIGFLARRNHFCTLSALERHWYAGDSTGLRTWVLAAMTALLTTQVLVHLGLADTASSFYLSSSFPLTGAIAGGVMFGFGMALVGTCGFGAVIRLGGGSLRALVVLTVIGLAALATQRGILGVVRVPLVDDMALDLSSVGGQSMGSLASYMVGADITWLVALAVCAAGFIWIFRSRTYRSEWTHIGTGVAIGLAISFGWVATTWASKSALDPVQIEAGSFVVPVGDTILQLITYTGVLPDYGVGLIVGVLFGAVTAAVLKKDIRWEACDDARELGRHILGGTLMGIGGVVAMGCTIGQGISGFSTLAISAPIVLLSIGLGARMGLSWLLEGSILAAFQLNSGSTSAAE